MSAHFFDGVPHDDGGRGDSLGSGQIHGHTHATEPTQAHMNSRSGDRVPAGVSGQAGRGTVGTVAPTTQDEFDDLAAALFSPVLWVGAAAYTAISLVLVWLALTLAPWGLLLLIPAMGTLSAAALLGVIAFGISRLEADPA